MLRFTLTKGASVEVLTRDPDGWEAMNISLRRDTKYHGVFKEYSQRLGFKCDGGGKDFIDKNYDGAGVHPEIELLIEYQCDTEGFSTLFDGVLDMKTYQRENASGVNMTRVTVIEKNIITKLKNREEIKIDLEAAESLDGVALGASYAFGNYTLSLHSRTIFLTSEIKNTSIQVDLDSIIFPSTALGEISINVPLPVQLNEIKETTTTVKTFYFPGFGSANRESFRNNGSLPFHDTNLQPFPRVVPGTYDFTWDIEGDYEDRNPVGSCNRQTIGIPFAGITLDLWVGPTLALATRHHIGDIAAYNVLGGGDHADTFSFSGSSSIAVAANDKIWIGWGVGYQVYATGPTGGTVEFEFSYDADSFVKFSIDSTTPNTTGRGWAIFEAWARITGAITDQVNAFDSALFGRLNSAPTSYGANGCPSFLAVTNGLSIRGFNNNSYDEPVTVSLKQIYKACDSLWNIGLGVENGKVKVEEKSYFYDSGTTIFTANNVKTMRMDIALETLYNQVKIGYKKWENEEVNGLDEVNTKQEWALPIEVVKKNADLLSEFIGSGYAIEFTRRKDHINFPTTDYKYDENLFFICLNRSVNGGDVPTDLDTPEIDENFSAVTNVLFPSTAYNLRISPKRNLLRHMEFLNGGFLNQPAAEYKFQSGEGNMDMQSTMNVDGCPGDYTGASLDEDIDIDWDESNVRNHDPLWIPEIYGFEHPVSYSDWVIIQANPRGVVQFTEDGQTKSGFILSLSYDVKFQRCQFTLLRANV